MLSMNLLCLAHYLGPSIDVYPAMTTKILTENRQVIHSLTYGLLTPDESQRWVRCPRAFHSQSLYPRELENIGLENTLQHDSYEDETQNEQTFHQLAEDLDSMPHTADLLLPRGDQMARGHVITQSDDASGNFMCRAHVNPIHDAKRYKLSELEKRSQNCKADGNGHQLLDSLIYYQKDKKSISFTD